MMRGISNFHSRKWRHTDSLTMSLVAQWLERLLYIWKVGSSIPGGLRSEIAKITKPISQLHKKLLIYRHFGYFKENCYTGPSFLSWVRLRTEAPLHLLSLLWSANHTFLQHREGISGGGAHPTCLIEIEDWSPILPVHVCLSVCLSVICASDQSSILQSQSNL